MMKPRVRDGSRAALAEERLPIPRGAPQHLSGPARQRAHAPALKPLCARLRACTRRCRRAALPYRPWVSSASGRTHQGMRLGDPSDAGLEAQLARLEECVVRTRQHSLRLLERVDLAVACFFP